jgi:hypothetical protein
MGGQVKKELEHKEGVIVRKIDRTRRRHGRIGIKE